MRGDATEQRGAVSQGQVLRGERKSMPFSGQPRERPGRKHGVTEESLGIPRGEEDSGVGWPPHVFADWHSVVGSP